MRTRVFARSSRWDRLLVLNANATSPDKLDPKEPTRPSPNDTRHATSSSCTACNGASVPITTVTDPSFGRRACSGNMDASVDPATDPPTVRFAIWPKLASTSTPSV